MLLRQSLIPLTVVVEGFAVADFCVKLKADLIGDENIGSFGLGQRHNLLMEWLGHSIWGWGSSGPKATFKLSHSHPGLALDPATQLIDPTADIFFERTRDAIEMVGLGNQTNQSPFVGLLRQLHLLLSHQEVSGSRNRVDA